MPAYIVSVRLRTKDRAALARYAQLAPAAGSAAGRKLKRLVTSSNRFRALNGDAEGLSILEFDTIAEAEAWFYSPEYQLALEQLLQGADYHIYLTEGSSEIFEWRTVTT